MHGTIGRDGAAMEEIENRSWLHELIGIAPALEMRQDRENKLVHMSISPKESGIPANNQSRFIFGWRQDFVRTASWEIQIETIIHGDPLVGFAKGVHVASDGVPNKLVSHEEFRMLRVQWFVHTMIHPLGQRDGSRFWVLLNHLDCSLTTSIQTAHLIALSVSAVLRGETDLVKDELCHK
jgi:hypothetical protein